MTSHDDDLVVTHLAGRARRVLLSAILLTLALCHSARAAFVPVVEHGTSNRVNAFFLGDGYTAADLTAGTYANHVSSYVSYMFANTANSQPFGRYANYFNAYRIDITSNQSGADEPQNGITKDTALDARYRYDGVTDRLLYVSDSKANTALNAAIAGSGKAVNMKFVSVNDAVYGGGGGSYAVFAGANSSAREVALHELAHSFSHLADEYGGGGAYTGGEPGEVNVTKDPTGAKWARWIGYNDPTGSVVGAYAGGRYYDSGIYRPTSNSKMRTLGVPQNAIDREAIILDIYRIVDPLDSYTANTSVLTDPVSLTSARIDNGVINTQWFVDGAQQASFDNLSSISPLSLGLLPGTHTIRLRAFDPTGFDPVNGWVRMNSELLEQNVTWNITLTNPMFPGDANGNRIVDATDLGILLQNFNKPGTFATGDFNNSGLVDATDLGILLQNFNKSAPNPLLGVPEPSSLVLAGLGGFALLVGIRRRRGPAAG